MSPRSGWQKQHKLPGASGPIEGGIIKNINKAVVAIIAAALITAALFIFFSGKHGNNPPAKSPASNIVLTSKYLPNEKLRLKYPNNWSETDNPSSATTDGVVLTSPNNLLVYIYTGAVSPQSTFTNVLDSVPINTLGSNYFLVFYNNHPATGGLAQGACVATGRDTTASYPSAKNIQAAPDGSANPVNKVCITYPTDESGNVFENPVSVFENDPSYPQALNIIKSISY